VHGWWGKSACLQDKTGFPFLRLRLGRNSEETNQTRAVIYRRSRLSAHLYYPSRYTPSPCATPVFAASRFLGTTGIARIESSYLKEYIIIGSCVVIEDKHLDVGVIPPWPRREIQGLRKMDRSTLECEGGSRTAQRMCPEYRMYALDSSACLFDSVVSFLGFPPTPYNPDTLSTFKQ